MTALKVLGIILLIFLLLGFLRVGAVIRFGDELCVRLLVGHIRLTIFPKKKKKERAKQKKEQKPKEEKSAKEKKKRRGIPKPTLSELLDLIETALSALGETARRACKRVRIDPLDVTVVFGGDDPALIAAAYGLMSAKVFADMPRAEEKFYIPNPAIHLRINFDAESTSAAGNVGISLRVCDLFAILFTLLLPLAKWFLRFKKAHKDDQPPKEAENTAEQTENTETDDKIA